MYLKSKVRVKEDIVAPMACRTCDGICRDSCDLTCAHGEWCY